MRKPLAFCLGAFLALAPVEAWAGIAIISGTGLNGAQTNPGFNAGTSIAQAVTSSIPAGSLVIAFMQNSTSGTSTGFSCSDTHGNTYTAPRAVDQTNGAATQILRSYTTTTINNGDNITCTQTSGPSGIVMQLLALSGTASSPDDVSTGNSNTGATGTLTVGPTASLACPGGGSGCEVLIGSITTHLGATMTPDANFVNIGQSGSGGSQFMNGVWIVSSSAARSYVSSTTSPSTNWSGQLVTFKSSATVTVCKRSLLGVGC